MTLYYISNLRYMNNYITALGIKPTPGANQNRGLKVYMASDSDAQHKDIKNEEQKASTSDMNESERQPIRKNASLVVNGIYTHPIDRGPIIEAMSARGVIRVNQGKKLPQQSSVILEESLVDSITPPSIDAISSDVVVESDGEEETKEPELKKTTQSVVIKKRKTKDVTDKGEGTKTIKEKEADYVLEDDSDDIMMFNKRLPTPVMNHTVKMSTFYMNNRKKFLSQLMPMFSEYKRELSKSDKVASCDDSSAKGSSPDFKLMIHQQVVRDYLNLYTPYRGLLLYHGLGSGKTCTSIAIAEGMKSQKKIYVLTLKSLKANFFDQMKVCGDPIYRLDQFWEFISIEGQPTFVKVLSKTLSLPEEFVQTHKGAWMVNVKQASNFQDLNDADKKSLNIQLDEMIRSKYTDLNYNGLTQKIMDRETDNYTKNPFDNCVVIIDEVHNFVSRIVNKLREKTSISYKLYEYLMSATNTRIVLLSGTPIINYPNEIGVLFNMLRGYIKTWTFPFTVMSGSDKPTKDNAVSWFKREGLNRYDYVEFSGQQLIVTRNPFGFENHYSDDSSRKKGGKGTKNKRKKSKSVATKKRHRKDEPDIITHKNGLISIRDPIKDSRLDETDAERIERIQAEFNVQHGGGAFEDYTGVELDETGNMSDAAFKKTIIGILGKKGLRVESAKVKLTNNKSLPDVSKEFLDTFIELGAKDMKNERVFQKRILGLTSYFKGADDSLYPSFVPSDHDDVYHIENIPMSAYQFGQYEKIRDDESKRDKQNKKAQAKRDKKNDASDLFKIPSTYRIASRMCCNFAFPDPPGRPQKGDGEKGGDDEIGEEDFEEEHVGSKRGQKKTKGGEKTPSESESDEEEEEEEDKKVDEEEEEDKKVEEDEEEEESKKVEEEEPKKVDEEESKKEEEDDILNLENAKDTVLEDVEDLDQESNEKEEDAEEPKETLDYPKRMLRALNELKGRADELFVSSGLQMYSPKFLKILENIQNKDNTGLHLLYSQFRTMEGVGIFKLVLEANGFAELKIRRSTGGDWELLEEPDEKGKPKFALHTGTESDEEKKIILNIYNSKWTEVPSSIVSAFQKQGHENNYMGDVVRVLMITSSGAEGINLKNTRFVHIMEPYWHMVRLEQVIGRARRICSHQDLPPDMRTVKVFLYMAVLTEQQRNDDKHIALRLRDISKLSSKSAIESDSSTLLERYVKHLETRPMVITTDQQLFENALVKNHVNSNILNAVKETAMDCRLYEKQNKDENLVCFNFGSVSTNAFASHPTLTQELADKSVEEIRDVTTRLVKYSHKGTVYALNEKTGALYDYKQAIDKIKDSDKTKDSDTELVPIENLTKAELAKYNKSVAKPKR